MVLINGRDISGITLSDDKKDQYIEINGASYKLAPESKIPTDDPDLPSYQSEEYNEYYKALCFVQDIYEGFKDKEKKKKYLPQWTCEPTKEWEKRIKRTPFHNFFKPAVNGFPGFLSDLQELENLYPDILEYQDDIDLQGNNLISFLWQADLKVIRDGFCGILVDMPRIPRDEEGNKIIKTLADQELVKTPLRPYLVLIDRRNILSVNQRVVNGRLEIERATIKECITVPLGRYGTQEIKRYKTFYCDGRYEVEVIVIQDDKVYAVTIEEGQSDLACFPMVLYSATDINPLEATPPLINLAEKNKAHYELYSEYREVIHKMNAPVPVRIGLLMPGGSNFNELPPMVLGPNSGIDVPENGDFKFVEPSGAVLSTDREELDKLEIAMHQDSLKFLSSGVSQQTATAALLDSAQLSATLSGIARLKKSAIEQIAKLWAGYYGKPELGGTCTVNTDLLKQRLDPQTLTAVSSMVEKGQLSTITFLEILKGGKTLPDEVTPALEVKRLQAEKTAKLKHEQKVLQQQQAMMERQTMAVNQNNQQVNQNNQEQTQSNNPSLEGNVTNS